jgi:hypothetical protein
MHHPQLVNMFLLLWVQLLFGLNFEILLECIIFKTILQV